MMPARTWFGEPHAVGGVSYGEAKIEKTDGSCNRQKSATLLSFFVETYGPEAEEELSTMATQYWAEGVWTRKMESRAERSLDEANSRRSHVETGERRPAGAVMCESRDLGF